jgi:hypothetical protein
MRKMKLIAIVAFLSLTASLFATNAEGGGRRADPIATVQSFCRAEGGG